MSSGVRITAATIWVLTSLMPGRSGPASPTVSVLATAPSSSSDGESIGRADSVAVLVGAADVGVCASDGDEATAHLVDSILQAVPLPTVVFVAGDLAYPLGREEDFIRCYEPSWGRFKRVTRPVPGNHEYMNGFLWFLFGGRAGPYFDYFGPLAGQTGKRRDGWYRYRHGTWDVYALNSGRSGKVAPSSTQWGWLEAELMRPHSDCSVVYLHHPRFGAGKHGDNDGQRDLWELLDRNGVDIWISGHEHNYQRFHPQTSAGEKNASGIRQFIVGTGGGSLHREVNRTAGALDRRIDAHGVLKLTLRLDRYDWEFILRDGTVWDRGTSSCQNTGSALPQ